MQPHNRLFAVSIDRTLCDNCGICVFECGSKVFRWEWDREEVLPSHQKACIECFICEIKCPHEAIKLTLTAKPKAVGATAGR